MEVYRHNREKIVLGNGDVLEVPELPPGWELSVADVSAPEFESEGNKGGRSPDRYGSDDDYL